MRPSWDRYFMEIAVLVSSRTTCLRRQVGAVIVKDKRLLSTGYNGAPVGLKHCAELGCLREKLGVKSGEKHELCRAIHAEQNAIIQAATFGVPLQGASIYITHFPCVLCSKMIINAGIKRIVYSQGYPDQMSQDILKEARLKTELLKP
ncbi:MAG: cytidine/deoxycytidylate deaminase family protein [Candidatus Latescibacteria bacterium]|nr:cytidine/deoxycytidylate deaminase family protein [Candidatus Latescibacterota bacterium]